MREPERGGTTAGTIRSSLSRVVLAAFVPLALIGAWQGYLAYRDSRELVANRLRANVWSMMDRSRDTFVIAHHSLEMGAENAAVQSISDQCDAVLARMGGQSAGIANIIRTDATGRVRCSGLPFRAGTRLDAHPWWQAARATGTVVLGEPQVGEISGRPMVVMAQPLYAADGSFSGTLSAGIDLGVLEGELRQGVRHLKGAALIVNGQGRSILAAGRRPPSRVGDPRKARFDAQLIRNQTGRGWVYVAAPLFGEAIYIVYAEGSSSFAARAFGRTWPILALPLLAALLALAAIWFGTQRLLLDWFPRLQQLARRIALGDFGANDPGFRAAPAEIASLADDLHEMARSLEQHEDDLREALESRIAITREVNHRVRNNLQIVVSLLSLQVSRARMRPMRGS